LLLCATAIAAEHAGRDDALDAGEKWDALGRAVRGVSDRTHPHIASLSDELLSGPPQARLAWAFHMLITGISFTPRPTPRRRRSPKTRGATS